jgi:hypothetical protein
VSVALIVTVGVSGTFPSVWWIVPAAVAVLLPWSLWRAVRDAHH